ncbi:MAG: 50S ribosomal protein L23 [Nanoarchaeota archaeon]
MKILLHPITTEKAIKLIEIENKILFVVAKESRSEEIKKAFEKDFNVKVEKVNTLIRGKRKIAYVKLSKETPAVDVATRLGIL